MALTVLLGCGYRLVGKSAGLPDHIKQVAIPLFENQTQQPDIAQRITEQVTNELINRGGYSATSRPEDAQAVLLGTVLTYRTRPVGIDESGRATRYEITIQVGAELRDTVQNITLWKDEHFLFRQQYDVTAEDIEFFDRSTLAIDLVSADFARSVVATILEGF